jgi:hypothetical protein
MISYNLEIRYKLKVYEKETLPIFVYKLMENVKQVRFINMKFFLKMCTFNILKM